jgi:cation transport ATPase
MFCGTCARTVEGRILALSGVSSASLSYASKLLRVELAPDARSEGVAKAIESEIARAGFSAKRQHSGWLDSFRSDLDREQARAVPAWLLAVVFFSAMWSSTAAFAKYLGQLTSSEELLLASISTAVGAPALLLGAYPFARAGLRALLRGRRLTLDLFIALGGLSALLVSLSHLRSGSSHTFVDSAAMVMVILLLAKVLEARLAGSMAGRIFYHIDTSEQSAERLTRRQFRAVPVTHLRRGDTVAYQPGQTVGVDGELLSPNATLDSHLLSGETQIRSLSRGALVLSGSIARSPIEMRVLEPVGHRLIDGWAESALTSQSRPHRYSGAIRAWESRLTMFALGGASLLGLSAYLRTGMAQAAWESFFVGVLIFCPCLFASILPLAKQMAHLALSRRGAILYRAECLLDLAGIETIFFDKTGTLEHLDSTFVALEAWSQDRVRRLLDDVARHSYHPVLQGLGGLQDSTGQDHPGEALIEETPGYGVKACWPRSGETMLIGRADWVRRQTGEGHSAELRAAAGEHAPLVALDGRTVGCLLTRAAHEERAQRVLLELACALPVGLSLEILSGDPKPDAGRRFEELAPGRIVYRGGLTPEGKAALIAPNALFVGDGLNDTLAMAAATVSLRVGRRVRGFAPVDVQLPEADLGGVVEVMAFARRFTRILKQTAGLAATYNVAAWTLAALGYFTPLGAVLAMLASLLLMTLSILRLLGRR